MKVIKEFVGCLLAAGAMMIAGLVILAMLIFEYIARGGMWIARKLLHFVYNNMHGSAFEGSN